jgi:hypothetical protein
VNYHRLREEFAAATPAQRATLQGAGYFPDGHPSEWSDEDITDVTIGSRKQN